MQNWIKISFTVVNKNIYWFFKFNFCDLLLKSFLYKKIQHNLCQKYGFFPQTRQEREFYEFKISQFTFTLFKLGFRNCGQKVFFLQLWNYLNFTASPLFGKVKNISNFFPPVLPLPACGFSEAPPCLEAYIKYILI